MHLLFSQESAKYPQLTSPRSIYFQLSGSILTLFTTHLLTQRLRRDTTYQHAVLAESKLIADSTLLPRAEITPLRARIARPSFTETLKDTWNEEIERSARWIQGWDLVRFREGVEEVACAVVEKVKRSTSSKGD